MPAWSTTGEPLFGGNVCAVAGAASAKSASSRAARKCFTSARVEIHRRRLLRRCRGFERDLWLGAVEDLGADRGREGPDQRVILAHVLIVVAARDLDAVLGPFELVLKRQEVLVRLEVGISLLKPLQTADRLRQPALRVR